LTGLENSKPNPNAPADLPVKLTGMVAALGLCPSRDNILLAVSGGPDSMAMACLVKAWHDAAPLPRAGLRALVVDHGLRAASGREAAAAATALNAMGIPASVHRITATKPAGGVQAWARRHRYDALIAAALKDDAVIMTAHHADDQIETVAMRLDRGSGLTGLAGMAMMRRQQGIRLARPFLSARRDELHQVLRDGRLPVIDDPSNRQRAFTRVRFRQDLGEMAKLGAGPVELHHLRDLAERMDQVFRESLGKEIDGRVGIEPSGWAWFQHDLLTRLPGRASRALLADLIRRMGAAAGPIRENQLDRLLKQLRKEGGCTLGGCEWRLGHGGDVVICREAEKSIDPVEIKSENGKGIHGIFDGRWHVSAPVSGRIEALGAARYAALRHLAPGIFGPRRVPARVFWSMPVFFPDRGKLSPAKDMGLLTLDDHGIIPHVYKHRNEFYTCREKGVKAWFTGQDAGDETGISLGASCGRKAIP